MAPKSTQNQPEGFHKFKKKSKQKLGSGEFENKIEKKVKAGPKKFGSGEFENKIKKTRKLGSGEFNDTSKKITKKATQNQPEGSGAPKKILGRGEFDDASKKVVKKTNKTDKTNKTTKPTSFGAAFRAARAKQGAGGVFTYKGKKFSTNKASDKKVVKKKVSAQTSNDAQTVQKVISKKTRTDFKKSGAFKGIDSAPGDNKKSKPKFFKGTNITPTATQQKRRRNT